MEGTADPSTATPGQVGFARDDKRGSVVAEGGLVVGVANCRSLGFAAVTNARKARTGMERASQGSCDCGLFAGEHVEVSVQSTGDNLAVVAYADSGR
jgi:hypothetical protein